MNYTDIDSRKQAFIFELDDVLYPEKDYLYQVYYLFGGLLEYTTLIDAKQTTDLMIDTYITAGKELVFDNLKAKLQVDEKYRAGLRDLMITARLPLKLLLYQNMLNLLQDIVVDRKKIFIVTNGNREMQLNKIKQTEWHGLEQYLTVYFTDEFKPKPESDVIDLLIKDYNLQRREILMIENSETDRICAEASGIDYLNVNNFL
ncbi:HAD hydrolase-like protein [Mucilaginibacter sp. L3T2-6]|uniref:HAD hydrolase-like protein n=1 Tax=Mucilaginibacter sp. L3T2-6 TaxID=3062491 RepID=UPI0026750CD9|nr:HAD hydrolase-like protein [Mucilaginibacter sp. L3T2-6]MDO3642687.1 HAD hydrolase-like protein [Mucilaginibacter sp. L3T2-6]MDV6215336.1 HAD hydrolase-like protein [Mucilaginibacter sp. L3T2-6]